MRRSTSLTVALLLLSACGREQPERADRVASAAVPGAGTAPPPPPAPARQDPDPPRTEPRRALAATAQAGYDRVVFEFAGDSLPGYHVEYVNRPVVRCGSGDR